MLVRFFVSFATLALFPSLPVGLQVGSGTPLGSFEIKGPVEGTNVFVVDAAGNGDFLDLPAAVAAAGDGDLLLVRPSATAYSGFALSGKGLSVVADGSGDHVLQGRIEVAQLDTQQFFGLRGFDVQLAASSGGVLEFTQSSGAIWVEDCDVQALGLPATPYSPPVGSSDAVLVTDCDNVVFVRTVVGGSSGSAVTSDARTGLAALRSTVTLFDAEVHGPDGSSGFVSPGWNCISSSGSSVWSQAQTGGTAVRVEDSFFYAQGSSFEGGEGGFGACCLSGAPPRCGLLSRPGGVGLDVTGASVAELLDVSLSGGLGGAAIACGFGMGCGAAAQGATSLGPVSLLSGSAHGLQMPTVLSIGSMGTIDVQGQVGEEAYAVFSEDASHFFWLPLRSVQITRAPVAFVPLGDIDAGGSLSKTISLPPMLFGLGVQRRVVQGLFFADDGSTTLGGGSLVHILP